MANDIEQTITEFTAKLKPISPGMITEAGSIKGVEKPPPPEVPPVAEEEACLNKQFKNLVGALDDRYVGTDIKDLVITFLEGLPTCPE